MNIKKIAWGIRALFYKLKMKSVKMPSYIGKPLYISRYKNIYIGKCCRIYPNIRIEIVNKDSFIKIGENVSIGQNCHFVSADTMLSIGANTTISGNVLITNCDHNYKQLDMHILDQELSVKRTEIGEGCFIGYGAVLQAGTVLGKHCIVGANSVVRGEFPDNCVIVGAPAKIVKRYIQKTGLWEKVNEI